MFQKKLHAGMQASTHIFFISLRWEDGSCALGGKGTEWDLFYYLSVGGKMKRP